MGFFSKVTASLPLAAAGFAVALTGSVSAETLVVTATDPVGSLKDRMCERFVNTVNEKSDDSLDLNFVRGEALGAANSVMEQQISGSVGIFCNELVWFADYVPDIQILGWGFTFRDGDHMAKFFESDLFKPLADRAISQGARILAAQPTQPRMMFTREPIKSIDDVQDIKMRVPQLKSYLELWKALGTRPTQVAWAEVYLGLSTGVVVAAEGPPTDAMGQKFHEVATNITRTDHLFSTVMISINEAAFQALSDDMKKLVSDTAKEATLWARGVAEAEVSTMLDDATKSGATVAEIDKGPFQERSRDAVERMEADGLWRKDLWADIQKL